ncbi:hypothetical protein [Nocardia sp. IFM 10818]
MTDGRLPGRSRWGTPIGFVLYRTAECWRYAVYLRDPTGIMDGYLPDIPPSAAVAEAQAELHQRAELAHGRKVHMRWEASGKPDWWTAEVTDVGPLSGDEPGAECTES